MVCDDEELGGLTFVSIFLLAGPSAWDSGAGAGRGSGGSSMGQLVLSSFSIMASIIGRWWGVCGTEVLVLRH
ncbi:hypothetical protein F4781DRAFT_368236 [Annulohypoxylon bovei var. microspora]|nr:hypothetical protein F4781DRAFT_368236 [Annulohypoxylon bovei var. microspora]